MTIALVTGRSEQRIGEADVPVISGLWRNDLLLRAKRLRFIQSIGGTDQFSREALGDIALVVVAIVISRRCPGAFGSRAMIEATRHRLPRAIVQLLYVM